ncbi:MAG: hypothetical protein IPK39_23385 [Sulfuritalea sp.]|nr:hypothetical protein [Sulfuritalea sp.]
MSNSPVMLALPGPSAVEPGDARSALRRIVRRDEVELFQYRAFVLETQRQHPVAQMDVGRADQQPGRWRARLAG